MHKLSRTFFLFLAFAFFAFIFSKTAFAIEDPLASTNNIFGIHIFAENDLEDAAALVNSSNGDWGYVTMVIRDDERDTNRWQEVFNNMRRLHIIPIIRIATHQEDGGWAKPSFDDIGNWVNFLNSLNWPIKNRYVVIGNEPNHAIEWGGSVNPEEYAFYLKSISHDLKNASDDFFILPAGFDSSAPNNKQHLSEATFLKRMLTGQSDIFDYIDGWTSHSYPNPDYSGKTTDSGAGSIRTYAWEQNILKNLNVRKKLPVFITETGWSYETKLSESEITNNYTQAFDIWSADPQIVAVTPFILNYQSQPFNVFSWKKADASFNSTYNEMQKVLKKGGTPVQVNKGVIESVLIPQIIKKNDKIYAAAIIENRGQAIWEVGENYIIETTDGGKIEIDSPLFTNIEPGHSGIMLFREVE
jgi:hypothetical protein